jgi:hypothetical protein
MEFAEYIDGCTQAPGPPQWARNQKNVQKLKFSSEFNKLNFI